MITVLVLVCAAASVSLNTTDSLFTVLIVFWIPASYPVIPLKPRIHPVNVVEVFPVYVIISSSIFRRP